MTGTLRVKHRAPRAEQHEVGAGGQGAGGQMHHGGMRDVAVGEHDLVHLLPPADGLEVGLVLDRDPVGIARAGQGGRVATVAGAGDLGPGEGDDVGGGVVAVDHVEVVEVAPRRSQDENARVHACRSSGGAPRTGCGSSAGIVSAMPPKIAFIGMMPLHAQCRIWIPIESEGWSA